MQQPPSRFPNRQPPFLSETMVSKTWTKTAKYPPPVAPTPHWQEGDIAFLQPSKTFSPEERRTLIHRTPEFPRGYIPVLATSHPVIILKRLSRGSTHVLITTVSAYSSGPENNYLAPWNQDRHHDKERVDFRSFEGCERSTAQFPPLFLRPGQAMRKPRTSWVHIQNAWVVPVSVLGRFAGVKGAHVVGLTPESLDDLRAHMAARCRAWNACQQRLLAVDKSLSLGVSGAPAGAAKGAAIPAAASVVVAPAVVAPAVVAAPLPSAAVLAAVAPSADSVVVAVSATSLDAEQLPPPSLAPAAPPAPTAVRTWAAVAGGAKLPAAPLPFSLPPAPKRQWLEKDKGKGRKPWEDNWRR